MSVGPRRRLRVRSTCWGSSLGLLINRVINRLDSKVVVPLTPKSHLSVTSTTRSLTSDRGSRVAEKQDPCNGPVQSLQGETSVLYTKPGHLTLVLTVHGVCLDRKVTEDPVRRFEEEGAGCPVPYGYTTKSSGVQHLHRFGGNRTQGLGKILVGGKGVDGVHQFVFYLMVQLFTVRTGQRCRVRWVWSRLRPLISR